MKYKVDEKKDGIDIKVAGVKGEKEKLLEAFRECQEGRCSCPTAEYQKLQSLEVEQSGDGIDLRLKSKPGETIDKAEIEKCLGYTAERVKK